MIYSEQYCRGQYSIQQQINRIAEHTGDGWAKRIQSATWREAVRLKLQEKTPEWCDYRAGTCYCEPEYLKGKQQQYRKGA